MNKVDHLRLKVGDTIEAEVFKVTSFGAFVIMANGKKAFIHISQISDNFVKNISDYLKLGARVKARVLSIDGNKIDLSLKKPKEDKASYPGGKGFKSSVLEDKLKVFLGKSV